MKGSHFDYSDQVLQETIKLQQRQIDLLKLQAEAHSEHIESIIKALSGQNKFDGDIVISLKTLHEDKEHLARAVSILIKDVEYLQNKSYGDRSI